MRWGIDHLTQTGGCPSQVEGAIWQPRCSGQGSHPLQRMSNQHAIACVVAESQALREQHLRLGVALLHQGDPCQAIQGVRREPLVADLPQNRQSLVEETARRCHLALPEGGVAGDIETDAD